MMSKILTILIFTIVLSTNTSHSMEESLPGEKRPRSGSLHYSETEIESIIKKSSVSEIDDDEAQNKKTIDILANLPTNAEKCIIKEKQKRSKTHSKSITEGNLESIAGASSAKYSMVGLLIFCHKK
jgi:hypothetical protein